MKSQTKKNFPIFSLCIKQEAHVCVNIHTDTCVCIHTVLDENDLNKIILI